jgi:uncharacterized protein (DUF169 family)
MIWQQWATRLTSVLGLKGEIIAVTYTLEPSEKGKKGNHWVCQALLDAYQGDTIVLTKESSACGGGTYHLGLGPRPSGDADRATKKFLVEGEKLFCSITTFYRSQQLTAPAPYGLADAIVIGPLSSARLRPDLVVFVCNPEQGCRLVTLATYSDGIPPKTEIVGSTCHMVIAYPLVSGELNISLLDYTSRRMKDFGRDQLFVTIPYHKMPALMESIDSCTAGTAKIEIPPEFRRLFPDAERVLSGKKRTR